jgi:hypothetical protein
MASIHLKQLSEAGTYLRYGAHNITLTHHEGGTAMIQHILLFRFKDDVPDAVRSGVLNGLSEFPETFSAMQNFALGVNTSVRDDRFTHALVVQFDGQEELAAYLSSDFHETFTRAQFRPAVAERAIVSFEVPASVE